MPTYLSRPVSRETSKLVRLPQGTRPLVVTLTADGIELRAKGTRRPYLIPYGVAWVQGAKLAAAAQMAERKARRAARKMAKA
jgi:F0F1-type ATP synthase epsilon subunit